MPAPRRFILALIALLTLASFLALPLAPTMAQRPPLPPERVSPQEHNGRALEGQAWRLPQTAERAEPAQPISLTWNIEFVDSPKVFRDMGPRSLALDGSGHPHIAYGWDHLYYAWHDGTVWHFETVDDSMERVGSYASLALDAADRPHISYFDWGSGDLKYVHFDGSFGETAWRFGFAESHGSSWLTETVDSAGFVGSYTSLALDANGWPHISYFDEINHDLKYAHFDGSFGETAWRFGFAESHGSSWLTETVDSPGDVGRYTSLALDSSGRPHISYEDDTKGDLKYAWGEE